MTVWSAGSGIFNPGISRTGFCKIPGSRDFWDGISLKVLSRDFTEKVWIWANLTNYVYLDVEFRCCHLVLVIYCELHTTYVMQSSFSEIREHGGNTFTERGRQPAFLILKTQKNGPFLRPTKCLWPVCFCFPVRNLYWQVRFARKPHSIWSIWAPRAPFLI